MNYSNVKNPQWANVEHTLIDCDVDFDALPESSVPFTANPLDTSNPSSKEIFDRCIAGDFGLVADYIPPPPNIPTADMNKAEAQIRLSNTDWVNEPDVIDVSRNPHLTNQSEFLDYRSAVRAIAVNPISGNIVWPIEPVAQWV